MSTPPSQTPTHVWFVLATAVAAISSAAVIVGALPDTHPLTIAAWRTVLVGAMLAPWIRLPARGDLVRIGFAGMFLAIHFATWFASLQLTTVLRSTVLVCLAPLWIGLAEAVWRRRPPAWPWWLGMAVAIPCAALLSQTGEGTASWEGDLLAAIGGICGAAYFMLGRQVRQRVGIATYGSLVCVAAAVVLLPTALIAGAPLLSLSWPAWIGVVALALGPQMLGHNGFNYALRFLPASYVSAATLLEPLGAGLLAWLFLAQALTPLAMLAGVGSVVGVGLATLVPHARPRLARTPPDP